MMRPRRQRRICFSPSVKFFKPRGIAMVDIEIIELSTEELEALRLKNVKDLSQDEAAEKMKTSQSTFQRILASAQKKVATALVEGKAIQIAG